MNKKNVDLSNLSSLNKSLINVVKILFKYLAINKKQKDQS